MILTIEILPEINSGPQIIIIQATLVHAYKRRGFVPPNDFIFPICLLTQDPYIQLGQT